MSVIIRLQNLPLTASSIDIRNFFHGLSIPDGGVHIVGGPEGDAFIAFSTDEDARQAMRLTGKHLKESRVSLLLSSRNEMYKVIEQARVAALAGGGGSPPHHQSSMSSNSGHSYNTHHDSSLSPPPTHHHVSSSSSGLHNNRHQSAANNSVSSSMSPSSTVSSANDYLRSITGAGGVGGGQADLSSNPALLFGTIPGMPSALGATPNAFLSHQQNQAFSGLGSSPSTQQQNQGFGGAANAANNSAAPPTSIFPNGNPFLIPPPNLSGMSLQFPGILQGANGAPPNASGTGNSLGGGGSSAEALGIPQTSGVMNLPSNFINSTMSLAGHGPNSMNPFGNGPPRMGLMNNGGGGIGSHGHGTGSQQAHGGGPRHLNNFGMGGMNSHGNAFGAGVGATGGETDNNINNSSSIILVPDLRLETWGTTTKIRIASNWVLFHLEEWM